MALVIYNTVSRQKETFVPVVEGVCSIYVCGPTVYDDAHLGHARAYVAFDTIVRFLRRHYKVIYVRNYTDIDDKIIKKANQQKTSSLEISERYIQSFQEDMALLGNLPADVEPKVTQHIPEIIAIIETLLEKDAAYVAAGDVYYGVEKAENYGILAKRSLEDMEAGARVEVVQHKRHPMDFVLWKAAKPEEPSWPSPWGPGRPGWHIECSAMSHRYLGATFDLHGGGRDLIFPHHENEIAQSLSAYAGDFAHYWLHNGLVNIEHQKMSKSLGNFLTIRQLVTSFDAETVRLYLISTHYRSAIAFTQQGLQQTQDRLRYCYETMQRWQHFLEDLHSKDTKLAEEQQPSAWILQLAERFTQAMQDDFNTPQALGIISQVFTWLNEVLDKKQPTAEEQASLSHLPEIFFPLVKVLGVFDKDVSAYLHQATQKQLQKLAITEAWIDEQISNRQKSRQQKNFAQADSIRQALDAKGVLIKDSPEGTTWSLKFTVSA